MQARESALTYHRAFGMRIEATGPIPGLVASSRSGVADLQLFLGSMPPWLNDRSAADRSVWYVSSARGETGEPNLRVWKLLDGAYCLLRYCDGTQFVADRSGSRVWATWPDQATLEDTATYLLGPILGFVLRLRGVVCLHASAIVVGDRAVALLGPAGAGKSTTAAIFARRGFSVLTDDVAALVERDGRVLVEPAYPRVRLWPDSVAALYDSEEALPRLTPTWDKRYLDLNEHGGRFHPRPLPLAAIYALGKRSDDQQAPFVEAVSTRDAMMGLIANGYGSRLLDGAMRAREFELLGAIVDRVPFRRVIPHSDPQKMTALSDVILRDFEAVAPLPVPRSAPSEARRV